MYEAGRIKWILATVVVIVGVLLSLGTNAADSYELVEGWAKLPAGMEWGQVISVDPIRTADTSGFPSRRTAHSEV